MTVRLLKIAGPTPEARQQRLARVQAWMEGQGWQLMDYEDEAGSAAFERPDDAPPLPRWHPTRWRAAPGMPWPSVAIFVAVGLVLVLLAAGAGGTLLVRSQALFQRLTGGTPAEQREGDWRMVLADYLNLRTGPGTDNPVVEVLRQGDRVRIVNQEDSWVELSHPAHGWVDERFLSKSGQAF